MIVTRSAFDFASTVRRLEEAIARRGLTVFARFDHAAGAREAGLELADELVVVFGDPRGGTPLMQSDPRVGIELPLRILVWQDAEAAMVAHVDPHHLADRYALSGREGVLEQMAKLLNDLAAEAGG
jgi:uncharacterized protein (DUF302 family)